EPYGVTQSIPILEVQNIARSISTLKSNWYALKATPAGPTDITHQCKLASKPLIRAEMIDFRQLELCVYVLVKKDTLKEGRLCKLDRSVRRGDRRISAKDSGTLNIVSNAGSVAHPESSILKEFVLVAFPVLKDRTDRETNFPVISSDLRDAVSTSRDKSCIS